MRRAIGMLLFVCLGSYAFVVSGIAFRFYVSRVVGGAHPISKLYFCEIAYQFQGDKSKLYVPYVCVCVFVQGVLLMYS